MKVGTRITATTSALAALTLGVYAFINLRSTQDERRAQVVREARAISGALRASIEALGVRATLDHADEVELVDLPDAADAEAVVLVHDDVPLASLLDLPRSLIARGLRVRLVARPKSMRTTLDALAAEGFTSFATVDATTTPESIEFRTFG